MASLNRDNIDLNLDCTAHPVTGDISKLTGADAIKRSIRNLILTNNYEVEFMPDLGSGITGLLFENLTAITGELIKRAIEGVVRVYEKRAQIVEINVYVDYDRNGYRAEIVFYPINESTPAKVDLFLARTR